MNVGVSPVGWSLGLEFGSSPGTVPAVMHAGVASHSYDPNQIIMGYAHMPGGTVLHLRNNY
jgi:hypothetical protein